MHKIGILGGTLDPIHIGHMIIAETALEELQLEKVIFMPSGNPPHKDKKSISDNIHRENMVKLSIEDNERFVFSDFEMKREGIIYTADTLKLLKEKYMDMDIFFILGADSLLAIETWYKPGVIFENCTIVVADRDKSNDSIINMIKHLEERYNAKIIYIKSPMVDISSSDIRQKIKNGKSIKYLVDYKVEKYIIDNKLF